MKLTPRLKTIADMVEYRKAADIGTDHGKIPVYLIKNNICDQVIACDINEGPVSACRKNVKKYSFEERIKTRLCDGIRGIEINECDSVIIAGMGGELISKIIDDSFEKSIKFKEIIIQPMSGIDKLRCYLAEKGFKIIDEKIIIEKDKVYNIIKILYDKPYKISFREMYINDKILNCDNKYVNMYLTKTIKQLRNKMKGVSETEKNSFKELISYLEVLYENI